LSYKGLSHTRKSRPSGFPKGGSAYPTSYQDVGGEPFFFTMPRRAGHASASSRRHIMFVIRPPRWVSATIFRDHPIVVNFFSFQMNLLVRHLLQTVHQTATFPVIDCRSAGGAD